MRRCHLHQSVVDFLMQFGRTDCKFTLHVFDEFLHIALHFFHPLPHVKYDLDTRQVHAEIASEILARADGSDLSPVLRKLLEGSA